MIPEPQQELDPDNLPPGTSLCEGRFVIEACLGRGGVATVYRVRGLSERRWALKLMVTRRAADGDQRERFDNEWKILRALRGLPYVVAVDRNGHGDDGRPFFTMELMEAPTLADLIMDRALSVTRACEVIRDVAGALDDLHKRGVIHRDIKPDNIMVTKQGIRLVDFGYACTRGSQHVPPLAGLTGSEHRPGTPLYMAPEQADGAPPAPSFDIYALTVTLYEALVGHAPGSEMEPARMMLVKCSGYYDELSIAGRVFGLIEGLERLVDHGLRRKPAQRVKSAKEFRDRMTALLWRMKEVEHLGGVVERPVAVAGFVEEAEKTLPLLRARVPVGAATSKRAAAAVEAIPAAVEAVPAAVEAVPAAVEAVPAAVEAVPAAVEPRRHRVAVVGGLSTRTLVVLAALAGALGSTLWLEFVEEASHEDVSPTAAAVSPEPAPAVEPAPEPVPEVEPTPEPVPEVQPTPVAEPLPTKPPRKLKTPRKPEPPPPVEPCTNVAAEAKTASRSKHWSRVLKLTKSSRCWDDDGVRIWLRVQALSELGRFAECAALEPSSTNPEARRLAKSCAVQLAQEKTP
jgi:eukaryotic-like serine/threonine-protein kinase